MHELSLAKSITEIVRQSVAGRELESVRGVKIRVGDQAGVVSTSLEFCFQVLTADSPLSKSRLYIECVPFSIHCQQCMRSTTNKYGFTFCPECGSVDTKILSGNELQVAEIELEDKVGSLP